MRVRSNDVNRDPGWNPAPDDRDEGDTDSDKAPATPLDEPRHPRVQDPPPQPDQTGPYVVRAHVW